MYFYGITILSQFFDVQKGIIILLLWIYPQSDKLTWNHFYNSVLYSGKSSEYRSQQIFVNKNPDLPQCYLFSPTTPVRKSEFDWTLGSAYGLPLHSLTKAEYNTLWFYS